MDIQLDNQEFRGTMLSEIEKLITSTLDDKSIKERAVLVLDKYIQRTQHHIFLVNKCGQLLMDWMDRNGQDTEEFKANLEYHDYDKLNSVAIIPIYAVACGYRYGNGKETFTVNEDDMNKMFNEIAWPEHYLENEHHVAEHYGTTSKLASTTHQDKNSAIEVPHTGNILAMAEMIADWMAMGIELGNTANSWWKDTKGKKWNFSKQDTQVIESLLKEEKSVPNQLAQLRLIKEGQGSSAPVAENPPEEETNPLAQQGINEAIESFFNYDENIHEMEIDYSNEFIRHTLTNLTIGNVEQWLSTIPDNVVEHFLSEISYWEKIQVKADRTSVSVSCDIPKDKTVATYLNIEINTKLRDMIITSATFQDVVTINDKFKYALQHSTTPNCYIKKHKDAYRGGQTTVHLDPYRIVLVAKEDIPANTSLTIDFTQFPWYEETDNVTFKNVTLDELFHNASDDILSVLDEPANESLLAVLGVLAVGGLLTAVMIKLLNDTNANLAACEKCVQQAAGYENGIDARIKNKQVSINKYDIIKSKINKLDTLMNACKNPAQLIPTLDIKKLITTAGLSPNEYTISNDKISLNLTTDVTTSQDTLLNRQWSCANHKQCISALISLHNTSQNILKQYTTYTNNEHVDSIRAITALVQNVLSAISIITKAMWRHVTYHIHTILEEYKYNLHNLKQLSPENDRIPLPTLAEVDERITKGRNNHVNDTNLKEKSTQYKNQVSKISKIVELPHADDVIEWYTEFIKYSRFILSIPQMSGDSIPHYITKISDKFNTIKFKYCQVTGGTIREYIHTDKDIYTTDNQCDQDWKYPKKQKGTLTQLGYANFSKWLKILELEEAMSEYNYVTDELWNKQEKLIAQYSEQKQIVAKIAVMVLLAGAQYEESFQRTSIKLLNSGEVKDIIKQQDSSSSEAVTLTRDQLYIGPIDPMNLDFDLIEKIMQYHDHLIILKKWITTPDHDLLPELVKFGQIIDDMYKFTKPIPCYRGIRSGLSFKPGQNMMGAFDEDVPMLQIVKPEYTPGYKFKFTTPGPMSMARMPYIAKIYGDFIVKAELDVDVKKLVITPELAYVLQQMEAEYPEYRAVNLSVTHEVIVFPDQELEYTVVSTYGDISNELETMQEGAFETLSPEQLNDIGDAQLVKTSHNCASDVEFLKQVLIIARDASNDTDDWSTENVINQMKKCEPYILKVNSIKVGGVFLLKLPDGKLCLKGLGIIKEHRRKGYAKEIIRLAILNAKSRNIKRLTLGVARSNKPAISLYKSTGFTITKTYSDVYVMDIVVEEYLNNTNTLSDDKAKAIGEYLYYGDDRELKVLSSGSTDIALHLDATQCLAAVNIVGSSWMPKDAPAGITWKLDVQSMKVEDTKNLTLSREFIIYHDNKEIKDKSGKSEGYVYKVKITDALNTHLKPSYNKGDSLPIHVRYTNGDITNFTKEKVTVKWRTKFDTSHSTESMLLLEETEEEKILTALAKPLYVEIGQNSWEHIQQVVGNAIEILNGLYHRKPTLVEYAALLFHDCSVKERNGDKTKHSHYSALLARPILQQTGFFTLTEINTIYKAIVEHDSDMNPSMHFSSNVSDLLASADFNPPNITWLLNKGYSWGIKHGYTHQERLANLTINTKRIYGSNGTAVYPNAYTKYHGVAIKKMQLFLDKLTPEIAESIIMPYRKRHGLKDNDVRLPDPSLERLSTSNEGFFKELGKAFKGRRPVDNIFADLIYGAQAQTIAYINFIKKVVRREVHVDDGRYGDIHSRLYNYWSKEINESYTDSELTESKVTNHISVNSPEVLIESYTDYDESDFKRGTVTLATAGVIERKILIKKRLAEITQWYLSYELYYKAAIAGYRHAVSSVGTIPDKRYHIGIKKFINRCITELTSVFATVNKAYKFYTKEYEKELVELNKQNVQNSTETIVPSVEAISNIKDKKKKIIDYICAICDIMDPSKTNSKRYHKLLDGMSDTEFDKWMNYVREGKWKLHIVAPNMIVNLKNENILKAADKSKTKLFHKIWMSDVSTGRKYLTDNEYLILTIPIRRQQQFLDKKMSVPDNDRQVDGLTGQVTGDSRSCSITNPEIQILAGRGLNATLNEYVNIRGGNMPAYSEFRRQAEETGEINMNTIDPNSNTRASVIAQVLLNAMHIDNNITE